mmetsp:Transcript_73839/g.223827  ORF Transcript_73839/g.223827 Transcript_73839/m.223827 type:complete len:240 (-) Transcript_73839:289-1008(-)
MPPNAPQGGPRTAPSAVGGQSFSQVLREAGPQPVRHGGPLAELTTSMGIPAFTIKIEQRWVGSLVGRNGAGMREIEQATGAIVKLDHASKALGYSVCRIYGTTRAADRAADLVRVKLAAVSSEAVGVGLPEGIIAEDFPVEHGLVGLVIGRGGENLKQIRAESGAEVIFDKIAEASGNDRFRIVGRQDAVDHAKRLLRERIGSSRTVACGIGGVLGGQPGPSQLVVEPQFVGRIIGKDK